MAPNSPEVVTVTPTDTTWTTRNTDIAACLGALRVPIIRGERHREAGTQTITTHYVFAGSDESGSVVSEVVEYWWNHWAEFKRTHSPEHPLFVMRAAIDSLRWIMDVHHGNIPFTSRHLPPGAWFETPDWNVAACIRTSLPQSIARVKPGPVLFSVARNDSALRGLLSEYEGYAERTTPIQWMGAALHVRLTLSTAAKTARVQTHYVKGELLNCGKECFVDDGLPPDKKRLLLREFRR